MSESGGSGDDADTPLLPASSSENELRDAVGVRPVKVPEVYTAPTVMVDEPSLLEYPLAPLTGDEPSYALPSSSASPSLSRAGSAPASSSLSSAGAPESSFGSSSPGTYPPAPPAPPPPPRERPRATSAHDRDDDDDDEPGAPRRSRKLVVVSALALVGGLGIAALIFLGRANSEQLALRCEPEQVVAEQGRSFPPWGTRALAGAEWKPIAIPPEAECKPRDTDSVDELTGWYLGILVDQASSLLTAREVTKVDLAEADLKQALLLARSPDKRDQRKEIERLLGDVDYWRALATLRDATAKLGDAAKQFETAAAQRPRHVSDASAWASYIRKVADELHVGPAGAHQSAFPAPVAPAPTAEHPSAPAGVALPVEPPPTPPPAEPVTAPDAGVPAGGVLL